MVKLAGHNRRHHSGPARVFDSEEDCFAAVQAGKIKAGDVVIQRGTNHAWRNKSDKPCRILFVLLDAEFDAELKRAFAKTEKMEK